MERRSSNVLTTSAALLALFSFSAPAQSSRGLHSIKGSSDQSAMDFKFEVFSIRPMPPGEHATVVDTSPTPAGFSARISLSQALLIAYAPPGPPSTWISVKMLNLPSWSGEPYDVKGRVAQSDLQAWQNQSSDHELLRSALRAALKERCKLAVHEQPSQERVYELTIAKGGPKLKVADPHSTVPTVSVKLQSGGVMTGIGDRGSEGWKYYSATMQDVAYYLTNVSRGIPVLDSTGLTERYDFSLLHVQLPPDFEPVYSYPVDPLGLKLKSGNANRPILVIDHVERPTPN